MFNIRISYLYIIFFPLFLHASKRIHVLFVLDKFLCDTKTVILNQATGLIKKGFQISILAKQKGKNAHSILDRDYNYSLHWGNIDTFDLSDIDVIICQYGSLGKECANYLKTYKKLVPLNSENSIPFPLSKPKLITFFRGSDITAINEIQMGAYDTLFEVGDLFLPVCAYYAYLLQVLGCDPKKILVQPSGINCDLFNFRNRIPQCPEPKPKQRNKSETIHIISVARLIEKKGIEYAIRAIASLIKEGYNIEYTIVGEGNRKNRLIALAKKLRISNRVHIIGHQSNQQVSLLLNKSHIFILPSVTCADGSQEGIPNAIKEAMATGLPIITTYHSGIRELITHQETGLLSPERDARSLADNIKYIMHSPGHWLKITASARSMVESFYETHYLNDLLAKRIHALCKPTH